MKLNFYKQPFRKWESIDHVYDAKNNFVFQFISKFDDKGNYDENYLKIVQSVMDCINDKTDLGLNVTKNKGYIFYNEKPLLLIRGWGNLTGIGSHNFSAEKAAKIQDDFQDWLIYKLSK
jgi:hypothetical protein